MKKQYFLIILVITLLSIKTYSQESKIKYSIQGGLNYSSFRGYDYLDEAKPVFGYLFGASFEYKIKEKLSLKVDLNYERKARKYNTTIEVYDSGNYNPSNTDMGGIYNVETTSYSNYIVLPILVKYNFSRDNSFYINGGPFLGFLINSGTKAVTDINNMFDYSENTTKYNKTLDFGMSFGIGKQFKIKGENKIYLELRDNLGLVNTSDIKLYNNGKIMTNSMNLILGYTIN